MTAHWNDTFSRITLGLSLAAAPAFAAMAIVSAMQGEGSIICMQDAWSLNSMATMYALMSVFHLAPWLIRLRASSESRQTCHSRASFVRE